VNPLMATAGMDEYPKWWEEGPPGVAVVTGGNKGIGLEICKQLASVGGEGLHIILCSRCGLPPCPSPPPRPARPRACPPRPRRPPAPSITPPTHKRRSDAGRGSEAVEAVKRDVPSASVEAFPVDITSAADVAALAAHVERSGRPVRMLVNNAGFAYKGGAWGADEAEATMDVNYRGTRRVSEAILPLLGADARVVNVCSRAGALRGGSGFVARVNAIADAGSEADLDAFAAEFVAAVRDDTYAGKGFAPSMYGVSKLCESTYTRILARRLREARPGALVAAMCPGWCATDMSSWQGPRSAAQGADTAAWLCVAPAAGLETGRFWADREQIGF